MESDFITDKPTSVDGMLELYKNIGSYLGTKENQFKNSVPKSVIIAPLSQVCQILKTSHTF